jgi:hypothetical protein
MGKIRASSFEPRKLLYLRLLKKVQSQSLRKYHEQGHPSRRIIKLRKFRIQGTYCHGQEVERRV